MVAATSQVGPGEKKSHPRKSLPANLKKWIYDGPRVSSQKTLWLGVNFFAPTAIGKATRCWGAQVVWATKNTVGRELLCFFSTFFQFLLKIMFFLLGLTKILIPHTTASFFPAWGVLSTDKKNQKRDIHWKPRKDRCLLALRYCEPGLAGGVLSSPMALCCYVSLLECMPVYAFFVLMPISI